MSKMGDKEYRHAYMQGHLEGLIPTQIRIMREQRGLTQEELAALMGTKQSVIARLENTDFKGSNSSLIRVAEALDVALICRFVPWPEWQARYADTSLEALQTPSYSEAD